MEKTLRKIATSIILLTLLLGGFVNSTQAINISELEEQIKERQSQIEELEKEAAALRQAIGEKKAVEATLNSRIAIMNSQIRRLKAEIKVTQAKINEASLQIQQLELSISQQELELEKQKDHLASILRTIYEFDQETLLELVLKNENFSDFLDQVQYIESLQKSVLEKVNKIKELRVKLKQEEEDTKAYQESLGELKDGLQIQEGSFNSQKYRQQTLLKKTQGEERKYQNLLNEVIAKKSAFAQEIQALEFQVLAGKNFLIHLQAGKIPPAGTKIFIWPEKGTVLTQGYGMTSFARRGAYGGAPHNGIDMSAGHGSPILAAAPGKILVRGFNKGWGNWVAIQHSENLVTLYAHLKSPAILAPGTAVQAGTVIGYEGDTGFSTGSHLHFSVYKQFFTYQKNGQLYFNYFDGTLNPLNYL